MKLDFSKITDPQLKAAVEALQTELTNTKTQLQSATQTISATELQNNRNEVLAFCESSEMSLRILPSEKEKFVSTLLSLKGKEKIELSAPDNTKIEFTAYDFLKEVFKQLPEKIELSELAKNSNSNGASEAAHVKLGKEIASLANK
jgi:Tfp pilus assembly protein PilO